MRPKTFDQISLDQTDSDLVNVNWAQVAIDHQLILVAYALSYGLYDLNQSLYSTARYLGYMPTISDQGAFVSMWFFYFNVGLTYLTIGVAAAVFFYFVLKKPVLGKFWGAIIVGLIGSFLGGLVDQLFGGVIKYLVRVQQRHGQRVRGRGRFHVHAVAAGESELSPVGRGDVRPLSLINGYLPQLPIMHILSTSRRTWEISVRCAQARSRWYRR